MILASASPRRQQLLQELGVNFECFPVDLDETPLGNEGPQDYVVRLAQSKALAALKMLGKGPVLGADTAVVCDNIIFGKPKNFETFQSMMTALSGKTHQVLTAIAMVSDHQQKTALVSTDVTFKPLSPDEIARYWSTGEPKDKAGGYGIQGLGGSFVKQILGSYSAVVGLPKHETLQLLLEFNQPCWLNPGENL